MTDKQQIILDTSLELFSNYGYPSTPTGKIAKKAGVSEGLIFRHYKSKKGLLESLIKEADQLLNQRYSSILFETNSKKVIRRFIKLPYRIKSDREFKLLKLRAMQTWEPDQYDPEQIQPLLYKLSVSFSNLNYKDPDNEARFLYHALDHMTQEILKGKTERTYEFRDFLLKKYKVNKP